MVEVNGNVEAGEVDADGNPIVADDSTPKTYTEAEMMALLQSEADRRVSDALKKQERKFTEKMAEADKLRGMDEEQRKVYEFESKMAEFEAEKKEFALAQNKLEAARVLSNRQLPVSLVDYVVGDDAETMMNNIQTFERIFKAAVNDAVAIKIAGPTPKSGGTTQTGLSKEEFNKLSVVEQQKIYTTNPELYKALTI